MELKGVPDAREVEGIAPPHTHLPGKKARRGREEKVLVQRLIRLGKKAIFLSCRYNT